MFDSLSERLQEIIKATQGKTTLTEDNMSDALREIRRALLSADVSLTVVKSFISGVKERAEGEKVLTSLSPAQQLTKIVHDELVKLLGNENSPLNLTSKPSVIMMLGLQGSGKTTSSAKLAMKLKNDGKNPLLVAADVYRPAAQAQLKTLAEQINAGFFMIEGSKDVSDIAKKAITYAKENNYNVVIIDTAGRLQIDAEMMAELLILERIVSPDEKLLVTDAMTGQEAVEVAKNFNEQLELTGVILTKLDGDTRGGAALSVVYSTGKPIKFIGVGEKIEPLENFYPERMATRILGMGDVVTLVERAQNAFDEKSAKEFEEKMRKAEFSFDDFLKIQKQMKALGSINSILSMLPIPQLKKEDREKISHEGEKQLKRIEVFISSMTPQERSNPSIINSSRKKRISKGCGIALHDINMFITQFEQMRSMMKGFSDMKKNLKFKMPPNMGRFGKFK